MFLAPVLFRLFPKLREGAAAELQVDLLLHRLVPAAHLLAESLLGNTRRQAGYFVADAAVAQQLDVLALPSRRRQGRVLLELERPRGNGGVGVGDALRVARRRRGTAGQR